MKHGLCGRIDPEESACVRALVRPCVCVCVCSDEKTFVFHALPPPSQLESSRKAGDEGDAVRCTGSKGIIFLSCFKFTLASCTGLQLH